MFTLRRAALCLPLILALPVTASAQVDRLMAQGEARSNEGAAAQRRVDDLADQALDLLNEYRTELKVVDGLKVYNSLLQKQVDAQEREKTILADSIRKVDVIERQIYPLMLSMIDSLEKAIAADVPFLTNERSERIMRLRDMMERADVTAAEKFRRVIEAYQIEGEYGRTIESYAGELNLNGSPLQVDFLRIGRVALLYQSVGGDFTGAWDKEQASFVELDPAQYKSQVTRGLRVARKETAPDMLNLPITAPKGVGQ